MENYKLETIFASTILFLFFTFLIWPDERPIPKVETLNNSTASTPDYENSCVIGNRYVIFGPQSDNPFEERAKATVIITAKQNGYVQYCWDHDFDKKDRALFSRSCKDFVESMDKNY